MADQDKTINSLDKIATKLAPQSMSADMYLVSHPMTHVNGKPDDYITFKIPFSQLATKLTSYVYHTNEDIDVNDGLFEKICTDLSIGELAHADLISSSNQISGNPIDLTANVKGWGPLAVKLDDLPALNKQFDENADRTIKEYVTSINNKIGFKDLAFTWYDDLNLKHYSHVEHLSLYDFTDLSAKGKIGISTAAELSNEVKEAISDYLSLGVLAHLDNIHQNNIAECIDFDNLISGWETTLRNNFLSTATDGTYGSIKTGFGTDNVNRKYAVQLNSIGNAFVEVPWQYKHNAVSVSFVNTSEKNTIVLKQTQTLDSDIKGSPLSTRTLTTEISAKVNIYIENNITRTSVQGKRNSVAIFSDVNTISSSAGQLDGSTDKYFRADGTFAECPLATSTTAGFMTSADYNYLYSLKNDMANNLPVATATKLGAVKIGCPTNVNSQPVKPVKLNNANQMYVDAEAGLAAATNTALGGICIGYQKNGTNFPLVLDNSKRAYTAFDMSTILGIIYPVGAIYITATETNTCPIAQYVGTWIKITGKYLLASGNLVGNENYVAGQDVAAGLPAHQHDVGVGCGDCDCGTFNSIKNTHKSTSTYAKTSGNSNAIYGASSTVRPKAFVVSVFKRTA